MSFPVIKGVSYGLAHAPSLVRYGSKPQREIASHGNVLLQQVLAHLRSYEAAVTYPPNQVFVGNLCPDALSDIAKPYYEHPVSQTSATGPYGSILPERELYARMKLGDRFDLLWLSQEFAEELQALGPERFGCSEQSLTTIHGVSVKEIEEQIRCQEAVPLFVDGDRLIGCLCRAHDADQALSGQVLLENLACKATGVQALQHLLRSQPEFRADAVDYLIGCGEEAVGDRYQRGGGNIAKAMGEDAGCIRATGCDLKAFCCAPVHALVVAGALVQSGVFRNVIVVGGGSLAKLGMKFRGHLAHDMPILEDELGSLAVWIGPDDGVNPWLRLDHVGKHDIAAGSSSETIARSTLLAPLDAAGLKITDVDKYAVEMHNPEVTEPAGSGNVPLTNYRMLAGLAIVRGEITRTQMSDFIAKYGMPGFAPTQGHIPSAVSFLGHARDLILAGKAQRVMFSAKGSLFLGRMTEISDGISILVERNGKQA